MCGPSVLIEHVETLYDFCKSIGSEHFSFLPTLLLLPHLKTKGKDAKDKEKLSRHQFVPGTFSGTLQCLVCDKTLLGKESFQCSSKFLGPMCAVLVRALPPQTVSSLRILPVQYSQCVHVDFCFHVSVWFHQQAMTEDG